MIAQSTSPPITFRVTDACAYLGISEYLLRKLVREKRIAHVRAGKLLLFRQATLNEYLENAEAESLELLEAPRKRLRLIGK